MSLVSFQFEPAFIENNNNVIIISGDAEHKISLSDQKIKIYLDCTSLTNLQLSEIEKHVREPKD